jgi:hypothetical protein
VGWSGGRGQERGRQVVGENAHEAAYGGTLGGAGGCHHGSLHWQRLLGQPGPEPSLQLLVQV